MTRGDGTNTFAVETGPSHGTLLSFDTATGQYVYRANANYNGTDSFTYTLTDVDGETSTATAGITINRVDDVSLAPQSRLGVSG